MSNEYWVDPAGKRHRGQNPFHQNEPDFTPEQKGAIHEGWTTGMVAEHAKGLHAPDYVELGCGECLARNPLCTACGIPTHRVSYHLHQEENQTMSIIQSVTVELEDDMWEILKAMATRKGEDVEALASDLFSDVLSEMHKNGADLEY